MTQTSPSPQTIIRPGDQRVVDANGRVTNFGTFPVTSSQTDYLQATGTIIGIYGAGGNGKTSLVCGIADRKLNPEGFDLPLLVLDAEAGIKSVASLLGPDLHQIKINTFSDVEKFIATAKASPRASFPWKSVYVDNLSDLVTKALREQGFHGQSATSSQPDYNAMTTRVTVALQDLRDICLTYGVNLFASLWEVTEKTEAGNIIGHRADVTPKLGIRIQGILDYIGYLTVLNNPPNWTRKLDFSPNPTLDSKMRRDKNDLAAAEIPFELYNPDFISVLNTIKRGTPFPKDKFRKPLSQTQK